MNLVLLVLRSIHTNFVQNKRWQPICKQTKILQYSRLLHIFKNQHPESNTEKICNGNSKYACKNPRNHQRIPSFGCGHCTCSCRTSNIGIWSQQNHFSFRIQYLSHSKDHSEMYRYLDTGKCKDTGCCVDDTPYASTCSNHSKEDLLLSCFISPAL